MNPFNILHYINAPLILIYIISIMTLMILLFVIQKEGTDFDAITYGLKNWSFLLVKLFGTFLLFSMIYMVISYYVTKVSYTSFTTTIIGIILILALVASIYMDKFSPGPSTRIIDLNSIMLYLTSYSIFLVFFWTHLNI